MRKIERVCADKRCSVGEREIMFLRDGNRSSVYIKLENVCSYERSFNASVKLCLR